MLANNAECYAVIDANPEAAEKGKEKYGAKFAFTRYEDIFALEEVDVVYIASPVYLPVFRDRRQRIPSTAIIQ